MFHLKPWTSSTEHNVSQATTSMTAFNSLGIRIRHISAHSRLTPTFKSAIVAQIAIENETP